MAISPKKKNPTTEAILYLIFFSILQQIQKNKNLLSSASFFEIFLRKHTLKPDDQHFTIKIKHNHGRVKFNCGIFLWFLPYTSPWSIIESATLINPPMLAPFT